MNLLKITKRDNLTKRQEYTVRIAAILLSIVFAGMVLLFFGLNPIEVFSAIVEGAVGTQMRIEQTVGKAVPLIITSMGILVAFKMKFWNIGGEGQIVMGALGAAIVALNMGELPQIILLPLMAVAAIIFGGIWAFIPAVFKSKMGTNETIFTLMMNYIAIKFVTYLQFGPWKDPAAGGFPEITPFSDNGILPEVLGIHIGWIIAIICTAFIFFLMKYTKMGYEIAVVGESPETARYAGMSISKITIRVMMISGGLCGLVGMIQASAIEGTLSASLSGGYGFTAIIAVWIVSLNPLAAFFSCIAFSILIQGGAYIQLVMNVPASVSDVVQGIILFFVLGSEFFLQYRLKRAKSNLTPTKEIMNDVKGA